MRATVAVLLGSSLVACVTTERGSILWDAPDGCTIARSDAEAVDAYLGNGTINTLFVELLRRPDPRVGCRQCLERIDDLEPGHCERVRVACRCGPDGSVDDAKGILADIRFDDLPPDDSYCVRVVQLEVPANTGDAWGSGCGSGFSCQNFLGIMPTAVARRVRVCSISEPLSLPGEARIANHACREQNPAATLECAAY